jgi:predicted nucleic acid-binding protein
MLAVLDTNVLVAALRSRHGASHALMSRLLQRQFRPAISTALALEYEDVLRRRGLIPGYTSEEITAYLDSILHHAHEAPIYFRWRPWLPDPGDDLVFECALASGAPHIVTFNTADFPGCDPLGISVVTPQQYLRLLPQP